VSKHVFLRRGHSWDGYVRYIKVLPVIPVVVFFFTFCLTLQQCETVGADFSQSTWLLALRIETNKLTHAQKYSCQERERCLFFGKLNRTVKTGAS
jgi:hypothetical protein